MFSMAECQVVQFSTDHLMFGRFASSGSFLLLSTEPEAIEIFGRRKEGWVALERVGRYAKDRPCFNNCTILESEIFFDIANEVDFHDVKPLMLRSFSAVES